VVGFPLPGTSTVTWLLVHDADEVESWLEQGFRLVEPLPHVPADEALLVLAWGNLPEDAESLLRAWAVRCALGQSDVVGRHSCARVGCPGSFTGIVRGKGERRVSRIRRSAFLGRNGVQDAPRHILQAIKECCFREKCIDMLLTRPLFKRGRAIGGG
jgi:hypothetical protein